MTNVDSPENFAGKFFGSRKGQAFSIFCIVFCARRLVKTYQPDIVRALSRTLRPSSKFVAPSELSHNRLGFRHSHKHEKISISTAAERFSPESETGH